MRLVSLLASATEMIAALGCLNQLVAIAGGENVFGEIGQHAPWLSWEELLVADPDILVLAPCGFTLERTMLDLPLLQHRPSWRSLQAVKNGRVYALDGNAYLHRSGPRLVESAEILSRILWGHLPEIRIDESSWMPIV